MAKQFFEIVDGYVFHTPESAKQAQKEVEGIRYIKKQLDMNHAESVLQVYNRILRENLFKTVVGYSFLRELQEYLYFTKEISNEDVSPLDIQPIVVAEQEKGNGPLNEKMKNRLSKSLIINVILLVLVAAMMALMYFSDVPTIINYENKIIDKYELWELELDEREKALEELEKN